MVNQEELAHLFQLGRPFYKMVLNHIEELGYNNPLAPEELVFCFEYLLTAQKEDRGSSHF